MSGAPVKIGEGVTSPLIQSEAKILDVDVYVDATGYVQNAGFVLKTIAALEKGTLVELDAIVLHRTDSSGLASPLKSFEKGIGTHFIVDKDGAVYQTASLLKKTHHVGKIKSRCFEEGSCSAEESTLIRSWGWAPGRIHDREKVKDYPQRYPTNEDSVGIEVVADHDGDAWEAPTPQQVQSIAAIISVLKMEYGVTDSDIYEHDKISYKTSGEGAGLYSPRPMFPPAVVEPVEPFP